MTNTELSTVAASAATENATAPHTPELARTVRWISVGTIGLGVTGSIATGFLLGFAVAGCAIIAWPWYHWHARRHRRARVRILAEGSTCTARVHALERDFGVSYTVIAEYEFADTHYETGSPCSHARFRTLAIGDTIQIQIDPAAPRHWVLL